MAEAQGLRRLGLMIGEKSRLRSLTRPHGPAGLILFENC